MSGVPIDQFPVDEQAYLGDVQQPSVVDQEAGRIARLVCTAAVGLMAVSGCSPASEADRSRETSITYHVDRDSEVYANISGTAMATDDPVLRETIEAVAETPTAIWLTDQSIEATNNELDRVLESSQNDGTIPVFVTYNLPGRDLGGESAGGFADPESYLSWVEGISQTIGERTAVMVVEPDALPGALQLEGAARDQRLALLRRTLEIFADNNNMRTYLDAGHSDWLTTSQVASLLDQVDPSRNLVSGVALNVSNQRPTGELEAYFDDLRGVSGRQQLVTLLDVSMNGAPDTASLREFCNPAGEMLGRLPDNVYDPTARIEHVFVKEPGYSDGSCGTTGAPAGEYDPALLLRQLQP